MVKRKMDQRVILTNTLLMNALVRLMRKKHISKISVRELCEAAEINRSTFYAHYRDQYGLLRYVEREALNNIKRHLRSLDSSDTQFISAQALKGILDYIKDNPELFHALISENSDFAFQRTIVELTQVISSQIGQSEDPRTSKYLEAFGVMGCISVLQKWLQDGTIESTDKMADLILQILLHGIASFNQPASNGDRC
jgi:AcrR family transcriptional regulator